MKGVAIPHLDTSKLINTVTAIPPLEEQKRIVNKVDQLMALCDELEKQQQKQRERRFGSITLCWINCSPPKTRKSSPCTGSASAITSTFFTTMWKTLPNSERPFFSWQCRASWSPKTPTMNLLQCNWRRSKLRKSGSLKKGRQKEKPLPPIKKEETPFDIPQEWEWARIGELASAVDYGTSFKSTSLDDGVPIIRMGNVQGGKVLLENLKYVPEYIDDLPKLFLSRNDLLFNRTNSAELVGKSGIFKGLDNKYTFASYLIRISFAVGNTSSDFVNLAMNAPYYRNTQIEPELTQQCGQANFNGTKLKFTLIPLPPTNEQMQIVAKVDKLMTLCDELEAKITRSQSTSQKLMEAVVREVVRQ